MTHEPRTFDHPPGEIHYALYTPGDVLPALDTAETDAAATLDLVAGDAEPLVAFGEATAAYDFIVAVAGDLAAVLGTELVRDSLGHDPTLDALLTAMA